MEEQPSFKESLDNAVVEVHESPTLKVLLDLMGWSLGIPNVLTYAVAGRGEVIARRRLEDFLQRVHDKIERLEKQAVNLAYLDSEEWHDLFTKALEEALRTRSNDKREYYARILEGAINDSGQGNYSPEEYLNLLASLTVKELGVARTIYKIQVGQNYMNTDHDDKWNAWKVQRDELAKTHAVEPSDLTLILNRVASTGLLEVSYVMFVGSLELTYWVTPMFDRLMGFLRLET